MLQRSRRRELRTGLPSLGKKCLSIMNERSVEVFLVVSLTFITAFAANDQSALKGDQPGQQVSAMSQDEQALPAMDERGSREDDEEISLSDLNNSTPIEAIEAEESSAIEVMERPTSLSPRSNTAFEVKTNSELSNADKTLVSVMNNQSNSIDYSENEIRKAHEPTRPMGQFVSLGESEELIEANSIESPESNDSQEPRLGRSISSLHPLNDRSFDRKLTTVRPSQSRRGKEALEKASELKATRVKTKPRPDRVARDNNTIDQTDNQMMISKQANWDSNSDINSTIQLRKDGQISNDSAAIRTHRVPSKDQAPEELPAKQIISEMKASESSNVETSSQSSNSKTSDDQESLEEEQPGNGEANSSKPEQTGEEMNSMKEDKLSSDEESNSRSNHAQSSPKKPSKLIGLNSYAPSDQSTLTLSRGPTSMGNSQLKRTQLDGRQLLVGPFKSEAEAPDTITLAGVVYQKSGLSSAIKTSPLTDLSSHMTASGSSSLETMIDASKSNVRVSQALDDRPKYKLDVSPLISATRQKTFGLQSSSPPRQFFLPLTQSQLMNIVSQTTKHSLNTYGHQYPVRGSMNAVSPSNVSLTLTSAPLLATLSELVSNVDAKPADTLKQTNLALMPISHDGNSESVHEYGWTNTKQKEVDQYSNLLQSAASEMKQLEVVGGASTRQKDAQKVTSPVVVVERSVKPVKYHLLKAYLKLRHLLRPVDATYVFPATNTLQPGHETNTILT